MTTPTLSNLSSNPRALRRQARDLAAVRSALADKLATCENALDAVVRERDELKNQLARAGSYIANEQLANKRAADLQKERDAARADNARLAAEVRERDIEIARLSGYIERVQSDDAAREAPLAVGQHMTTEHRPARPPRLMRAFDKPMSGDTVRPNRDRALYPGEF